MDELLKPNEVIINSFFADGKLKHELVSDIGEKNIKEVIKYLTEPVKKKEFNTKTKREKLTWLNVSLTINQLRKYYDSFLKIYNNACTEDEKKIQLIMLKANSEYAAKRLNTNRFNIFIANRINIVVEKNDKEFYDSINALKLHLEALVAYYPKNKGE